MSDTWSSLIINSFGKALSVENCLDKQTVLNQSTNTVLQNAENCRLYGSVSSKHKAEYEVNRPMISCEVARTVGLKEDGTVVAVGDNKDGLFDVSEWRDIVAVSSSLFTLLD